LYYLEEGDEIVLYDADKKIDIRENHESDVKTYTRPLELFKR